MLGRRREPCPGVPDRRVDLRAVPDDPGVSHQPRPIGPVERGDDQGQRVHQVGRQLDHELALQQRLANQPQIKVLQIMEASVDQLGGPAARPGGKIGLLDQGDAQPELGGAQGAGVSTRAGPQHHHVEVGLSHRVPSDSPD